MPSARRGCHCLAMGGYVGRLVESRFRTTRNGRQPHYATLMVSLTESANNAAPLGIGKGQLEQW